MSERRLWSERFERDRQRCPHCGRPRSECSDPSRPVYPQRDVCYATMERLAAAARYADLHKERPYHDGTFRGWSKERTREAPYHFDEGVTIWVADTDVNPHDHFLGGAESCPECRSALEAVEEPEGGDGEDHHQHES